MSTEKIRKAIRERLEEIYEIDLEYQFDLSKVVIPFNRFFKKSDSAEEKKQTPNERKEEYIKLLMQEL